MGFTVARYSYFDDFTEEERQMVRAKQIEQGQSWKEIIQRFGHPKDWEENQNPLQPTLFDVKEIK
jgi:hypothetical protein